MKQLIIANWKMQRPYAQAIAWGQQHKNELIKLTQNSPRTLIICPDFTSLQPLAQLFAHTHIAIGAQDCSAHESGAYTAQVSAQSLQEIGCTYCIIGHSEVRSAHHESHENIAQKMQALLAHAITPIICVGETEKNYQEGITLDILRAQLKPIIAQTHNNNALIYIAYEPIWAIGTGISATPEALVPIFEFLKTECKHLKNVHFLYGGSVTAHNYQSFLALPGVSGLLVGSASLEIEFLRAMLT